MSIPCDKWIDGVELIVKAFADISFQRKAWRGVLPSAFGSPDEMMCVYFDDVDVPGFIGKYAKELGQEGVDSGLHLTYLLENYPWPMVGEFIDSEILLEQPEWNGVLGSADDFLNQLRLMR